MTDGMRLRVLVRGRQARSSNLFARLTKDAVARLLGLAGDDPTSGTGDEFLPLEIVSDEGQSVYASYNGGELQWRDHGSLQSQGEANDCIDVPPGLLPSNATFVTVRAIVQVKVVTDLLVEPLGTEDWELLQLDAAWLEHGGLLQQVSVVYSNQVLALHLKNGRDVAQVRVLASNFERLRSVWPEQSEPACLHLRADTQLVVSPKPRVTPAMTAELRLVATREDFGDAMLELASHLEVVSASVAQCTAALHPSACSDRHVVGEIGEVRFGCESAIVRITTSAAVPENCIAIHPLVRLRIKADLNSSLTLKILTPFEIDRLSVGDIVRTRRAQLRLQKAKLEHPVEIASWRTPGPCSSNCFARFESGGSGQRASDGEDWLQETLSTMADIPLEIGAILFLPWEHSAADASLYRLILESDLTEYELPAVGFVFAADLAGFLRQHEGEPELTSIFSLVSSPHLQGIPPFVSLSDVIPSNTVFTPSVLSLIKSATNRSTALIHGERGSGKTNAALAVAAAALLKDGTTIVYLDCRKLKVSRVVRMNTILEELSKLFKDADSQAPCLVVLDDLDELCPSFGGYSASDDSMQAHQVNPVEIDQAKLITDVLRLTLRSRMTGGRDLSLVVTCRAADSLPETLLSDIGFAAVSQVPALQEADRGTLFSAMVQRQIRSPGVGSMGDFGQRTHGFRPRDIEQLALRAIKTFESRTNDSGLTLERATLIELEKFVPLTRLGAGAEEESSVRWSDVGGLFAAKDELTSTILRPSRYRRIYERARIRLPRGILLFGFPGTGKSFCVPALAKECGFPLIMCRGPELLDKYIGASEAKVRELFSRAASAAPSILFLDEFDALAPKRGSDHTGVTDRVVNQLLTFLDGVEDTAQSGQVYVIAATSRPDKVDPALLRPGRLEKHIYVGFAEGASEWTDILTKISSRYKIDPDLSELISLGRFIEDVQRESPLAIQLSAADAKAIFSTAQLAAVHEALDAGLTDDPVTIGYEHLMLAFRTSRPSLSNADYQRLKQVYSAYRIDVSPEAPADTMGSGSASKPLRVALR